MINPRPSDPPPQIEVLAVWGWAVQHGGIPLAYAAAVVADHPVYTDHSGVPDPTPGERLAWATDDLRAWEDVVVHMDWPGDDAIDKERWDQPADWEVREQLLRHLGLSVSNEPTDRLLLRHCEERIRECERRIAEDRRTTDEGQDR